MSVRDHIARAIAWALPRRVVWWANIRAGAHATSGRWGTDSPAEVKAVTVLERWDEGSEARPPEHRFELGPLGLEEECERCGLTPAAAWAVPCDPS